MENFTNDIKLLCDDIYYIGRNIKGYIENITNYEVSILENLKREIEYINESVFFTFSIQRL